MSTSKAAPPPPEAGDQFQWKCDICNWRQFRTFDEASAHELSCRGDPEPKSNARTSSSEVTPPHTAEDTSTSSSSSSTSASSNPKLKSKPDKNAAPFGTLGNFFSSKKSASESKSNPSKGKTLAFTAATKPAPAQPAKVAPLFSKPSKPATHSSSSSSSSSSSPPLAVVVCGVTHTSAETIPSSSSTRPPAHSFFGGTKGKDKDKKTKKKGMKIERNLESSDDADDDEVLIVDAPTTNASTTPSFFMSKSEKAVQKLYEVESRQKQLLENQKKQSKLNDALLRRNADKPVSAAGTSFFAVKPAASSNKSANPSSSASNAKSITNNDQLGAPRGLIAPRFPVPSHVGVLDAPTTPRPRMKREPCTYPTSPLFAPPSTTTSPSISSSSSIPLRRQDSLYDAFAAGRSEGASYDNSLSEDDPSHFVRQVASAAGISSSVWKQDLLRMKSISRKLSSSQPSQSLSQRASPSSSLWTDSFSPQKVPDDIVGHESRVASKKLLKFLKVFVDARNERIRNQDLKKKKKKKKASEYYYDEDDSDFDDERSNTFVICGPSGTCKTAMVHAATRQICGRLLEVNTGESRGNTTLKKRIEEATQSEMMSFDANDGDSNGSGSASPMAVILIDEVDITFSSHGDAGVWTAIRNLVKKTKCPVILTCSSTSDLEVGMGATSRFDIVYTARPSIQDCMYRIALILAANGRSSTTSVRSLHDVSSLLRCDIRRLLLEYQSQIGIVPLSASVSASQQPAFSQLAHLQTSSLPEICSVFPECGASDASTSVKITGRNFSFLNPKSCSLRVMVNGSYIPSTSVVRVSDNEINVEFPPAKMIVGVNRHGVYDDNYEECYSSTFAEVVIEMVYEGGIALRSNDNVSFTFVWPEYDGDKSLIEWRKEKKLNKKLRLQSEKQNVDDDENDIFDRDEDDPIEGDSDSDAFVTKKGQGKSEESPSKKRRIACEDEEDEDKDEDEDEDDPESTPTKHLLSNKKIFTPPPVQLASTTSHAPLSLISEEMKARYQQQLLEMQNLSKRCDVASLSAHFEENFYNATPALAGAVLGFGEELENSLDNYIGGGRTLAAGQLKNSVKTLSNDRLYERGLGDAGYYGSCDTFVQLPLHANDRRLLSGGGMKRADRYVVCCDDEKDAVGGGADDGSIAVLQSSNLDINGGGGGGGEERAWSGAVDGTDFLSVNFDSPFQTLPAYLSHLGDRVYGEVVDKPSFNNMFIEKEKYKRACTFLKLLKYIVPPENGKSYSYVFGLTTDFDPFEHRNNLNEELIDNFADGETTFSSERRTLDYRLALDYFPAIRRIAVDEDEQAKSEASANDDEDQGAGSAGGISGGLNNRRESAGGTRRSRRNITTRLHYFDVIGTHRPSDYKGASIGAQLLGFSFGSGEREGEGKTE